MDERELEASNRRIWIILGVGAALVALGLLLTFFIGKGVGAAIEDFDTEGVARAVGEGMKEVGQTAEAQAAKVAATEPEPA
jgi:flagellar basal body-associated protein FliL